MASLVEKSQPAETRAPLRYVARQPILSADEKVFGYELLFRDGVQDYFGATDHDAASRGTLDTSLLLGLDVLCDGRRAFINCTREVLVRDYLTLLPPDQAVMEVLETVAVDDLVVAACVRMKALGYKVALDDFIASDPREKLVELADIIKVDVQAVGLVQAAEICHRYGSKQRLMLAEKVEKREEFIAAKAAGFALFQGYFFRKPELMHAREIPANRLNYVRLLKAISEPDWKMNEVEGILKAEASLTYRLLRYLNSPLFGLSHDVQNIRHALSMLGERETRRWIRMAATLAVAQARPSDLVLSALVRGRFLELLSPKVDSGESDLFLLGMLSLMDAILEVPIGLVLEGIAVSDDIRAALLGNDGPHGVLVKLAAAQESGDWQHLQEFVEQLRLPPVFVAESYWSAMQWARQVTSGM